MEILRTPDERFESLPGYDYEPHYTDLSAGGMTLRMHHVDEGSGPVVLMLHGEPTWSYLYRKMIPILTEAGLRAVAPDLVGFGRSDKPVERGAYSYQAHIDWLSEWLIANDLTEITLFCQDWGGLLGLRLAAEHPRRFARIVAANTTLPTGEGTPPSDAFMAWRKFSQESPDFAVGSLVAAGCSSEVVPEVIGAYDAPFPDETFKAGVRMFPVLVPVAPDDPASQANRDAWKVLEAWDKPFATAYGVDDPMLGTAYVPLRERIPTAQNRPHIDITGAGHFVQEDAPEDCAQAVIDLIADTA